MSKTLHLLYKYTVAKLALNFVICHLDKQGCENSIVT